MRKTLIVVVGIFYAIMTNACGWIVLSACYGLMTNQSFAGSLQLVLWLVFGVVALMLVTFISGGIMILLDPKK